MAHYDVIQYKSEFRPRTYDPGIIQVIRRLPAPFDFPKRKIKIITAYGRQDLRRTNYNAIALGYLSGAKHGNKFIVKTPSETEKFLPRGGAQPVTVSGTSATPSRVPGASTAIPINPVIDTSKGAYNPYTIQQNTNPYANAAQLLQNAAAQAQRL